MGTFWYSALLFQLETTFSNFQLLQNMCIRKKSFPKTKRKFSEIHVIFLYYPVYIFLLERNQIK